MSCLSCIDLATLNKKRLEKQVQYKLSLWSSSKTTSSTTTTSSSSKSNQNQINENNLTTSNHEILIENNNRNSNIINNCSNNSDGLKNNLIMNKVVNCKNESFTTIQQQHQQQQQQNQKIIEKCVKNNENLINNKNNNNSNNNNNQKILNQKINCNINKNNNDCDIINDNFKLLKLLNHSNNNNCNNINQKQQNKNQNTNNNNQQYQQRRRNYYEEILLEDSIDPSLLNHHFDDYFCTDYLKPLIKRGRSGTWPRTRSLIAPSPYQNFGPCGRIMKNSAMVMQIQDPASQRLTWYRPPLTVLVIKKVRDSTVIPPFVELVVWLVQEKHMVVWVEAACLEDPALQQDEKFQSIREKLVTFKDSRDDLTDRIDFIVCLGGDGTLLYASLLFQQSVPPVMAFHLGSLGFLTPFQFDNFREQVTNVLEGHAALTLRSRLCCILHRKSDSRSICNNSTTTVPASASSNDNDAKELLGASMTTTAPVDRGACTGLSSKKPAIKILVLNEVVIDRGPSPYLSNIDLYLDDKLITSVQGDGLIVSTPTGSTAYAVAAGASMIHPSVPAIMVTPICPHSLSFRPIVVPAGVELKISISPDSRNTAWVSFDGRNRQELSHGDCLIVTMSIYPVPSICAQDQISDWFDSLAECLHWNVRKRQRLLDELSDLTASGSEDNTFDELERSEHIDS